MTGTNDANTPNVRIEPLADAEIPALIALAREIWFQHYPGIITVEQIEYMLGQRYTPEVIGAQLRSGKSFWDTLRVDGALVGFSNYEPKDGAVMKLDKLYVRAEVRGRGLGGRLIRRIAERARALGCTSIELQVNKHNADSIAAYRRSGFVVAREAVFDIGRGFVMDDYVMRKPLEKD